MVGAMVGKTRKPRQAPGPAVQVSVTFRSKAQVYRKLTNRPTPAQLTISDFWSIILAVTDPETQWLKDFLSAGPMSLAYHETADGYMRRLTPDTKLGNLSKNWHDTVSIVLVAVEAEDVREDDRPRSMPEKKRAPSKARDFRPLRKLPSIRELTEEGVESHAAPAPRLPVAAKLPGEYLRRLKNLVPTKMPQMIPR